MRVPQRFPFLKPTHRNHIKIKSKPNSHQNRIKIVSKPCKNISKPENPQEIDHKHVLGLFSKPTNHNQNQIVSRPYQAIAKPQKPSRHQPKGCPGVVFVSFLETNPLGTLKKALRSQTTSKSYRNHTQNHI
jgi:hypothetical protein